MQFEQLQHTENRSSEEGNEETIFGEINSRDILHD